MTKQEDFIKLILDNKKMILEHLNEEHKIDIAVYNTKKQMLMADIELLEKQDYK